MLSPEKISAAILLVVGAMSYQAPCFAQVCNIEESDIKYDAKTELYSYNEIMPGKVITLGDLKIRVGDLKQVSDGFYQDDYHNRITTYDTYYEVEVKAPGYYDNTQIRSGKAMKLTVCSKSISMSYQWSARVQKTYLILSIF